MQYLPNFSSIDRLNIRNEHEPQAEGGHYKLTVITPAPNLDCHLPSGFK